MWGLAFTGLSASENPGLGAEALSRTHSDSLSSIIVPL